ncbi:MAG: hypothetical protein R6U00_05595 [Prochlorococcaceae cyanobacterium]
MPLVRGDYSLMRMGLRSTALDGSCGRWGYDEFGDDEEVAFWWATHPRRHDRLQPQPQPGTIHIEGEPMTLELESGVLRASQAAERLTGFA